MGNLFTCCTSATAWEHELSEAWPRYSIRRTFSTASHFTLEFVREHASVPSVIIEVQLSLTASGRLHAGSLHPARVTITASDGSSISYDAAQRTLQSGRKGEDEDSQMIFRRAIAKRWHASTYDTSWRSDGVLPEGLPQEFAVLNNKGRAATFRGSRPEGASSERSMDLIAMVPDTHGQLPSDWSCGRVFEVRLNPKLEQQAKPMPGALAAVLAICTEGFWSQGAIIHGDIDDPSADSHGGATDEVALLNHQSKPRGMFDDGAHDLDVVYPAKSLWRGYQTYLRKKARKAQREKRYRGLDGAALMNRA